MTLCLVCQFKSFVLLQTLLPWHIMCYHSVPGWANCTSLFPPPGSPVWAQSRVAFEWQITTEYFILHIEHYMLQKMRQHPIGILDFWTCLLRCSNEPLVSRFHWEIVKPDANALQGQLFKIWLFKNWQRFFTEVGARQTFNSPFPPSILVGQPLHHGQEDLEGPVDDSKSKAGATWELSF